MPHTLQEFLAAATQKAADELAAALLRLPEDKRAWSPGGTARTALDQVAECAILNGYTTELIQARTWQTDAFANFPQEKADLSAQTWDALSARLQENTARVIAAIRAVPDEALPEEIALMGTTQTFAQILAYPYWNMIYHQGQINYIASVLGCLP